MMERILRALAFLAYRFNKKHLSIARANLDLVYGDSLSDERKNEIIYNSYKSLVFNMYELVENQNISREEIFKKATITNEHHIQKALADNRKIIYITAHYGGWEITLPYIALKFGDIAVVNRRMDNPHIQKKYAYARSKNSITMLEKESAAKGMIKAFKDNKKIAVVIDQHIGSGIEVEFLNQKDLATDSVARLALKFDAIIIPIFTQNRGYRSWDIKIYEPLDVRNIEFKTDNHIAELTQMQNDLVSQVIFEKPDFWLWQHKRFKEFHNDIYKKPTSR